MIRAAVRFSVAETAMGLGPTDFLRLWQDALANSGLPVALTDGRAPRPRFGLAARLPEGYLSDDEWLDLSLTVFVPPTELLAVLRRSLPAGIHPLECRDVREDEPSLASQLKWAEYRVRLAFGAAADSLEARIDAFFAAASIPWQEEIEGRSRSFDLRALADDLWVEQSEGGIALGMRLDAAATGTGRPDAILAGLGITDVAEKRRTRLLFAYLPYAVGRWLRVGRFESER